MRRTTKCGLRQVDFTFEGNEIQGLEQNPQTKSRWAQLARSGSKVMQFLSEGRYVANVVEPTQRTTEIMDFIKSLVAHTAT